LRCCFVIYFVALSLHIVIEFHIIICWCFIRHCLVVSVYILFQLHRILYCYLYIVLFHYIFCSFVTYCVAVLLYIFLLLLHTTDDEHNIKWNKKTILYENSTKYITKMQNDIWWSNNKWRKSNTKYNGTETIYTESNKVNETAKNI